MLQPYQVFHFDSFRDARGELCVFENDDAFQIRRVFFIQQVPPNATRGNHASTLINEIIVLTAGHCKIDLHDGKAWHSFSMLTPMDALYVPKMTWIRLYDFSPDCVLTVLADQPYAPEQMVGDLDAFLKIAAGE